MDQQQIAKLYISCAELIGWSASGRSADSDQQFTEYLQISSAQRIQHSPVRVPSTKTIDPMTRRFETNQKQVSDISPFYLHHQTPELVDFCTGLRNCTSLYILQTKSQNTDNTSTLHTTDIVYLHCITVPHCLLFFCNISILCFK